LPKLLRKAFIARITFPLFNNIRTLIYTSASLPNLNSKVLCIFSSLSLLSHLPEKCGAKKGFMIFCKTKILVPAIQESLPYGRYKFMVKNSESALFCENGNYVNLKKSKMKYSTKFCDFIMLCGV